MSTLSYIKYWWNPNTEDTCFSPQGKIKNKNKKLIIKMIEENMFLFSLSSPCFSCLSWRTRDFCPNTVGKVGHLWVASFICRTAQMSQKGERYEQLSQNAMLGHSYDLVERPNSRIFPGHGVWTLCRLKGSIQSFSEVLIWWVTQNGTDSHWNLLLLILFCILRTMSFFRSWLFL